MAILDIAKITEGRTVLEVPNPSKYTFQGQYAPFKAPVFYNPRMEFSRDIAILALRSFTKTRKGPLHICDPLGGLGARGVRYAKEVEGIEKSVIGDLNHEAIPLIKRNAILNGVENLVEVVEKDANLLLTEHAEPGGRFDFIDVDPFGPPTPFLDSAIRALKNKGVLAITATDTAPLCGVHTKACIRKYGAVPLHNEFCHETGLRIMIGTLAREVLKYDFGVDVLLSYSVDHYFRAYVRATMGAKRGDLSASKIGYLLYCPECGWRGAVKLNSQILCNCGVCGKPLRRGGPLWIGALADRDFLEALSGQDLSEMNTKKRISKFLTILEAEKDMPVSYYVLDWISSKLKCDVPAIGKVIQRLKELGYDSGLTHFHPKAIKTNAPYEIISDVVREAKSRLQ
ncbi:MAG: tRNA (guanine(10)-N(2))-dimethyltransferase [Candidatus Methanomethylicus sp.]|nr:tRNA (guanine(10)-N(2))-dimethyltransferase [Candidatus Methanomethylicus sp.]